MRSCYALAFLLCAFLPATSLRAQCSLTNATSCVCQTSGQTTCDLLPDLTISWFALQNYAAGPNEYSQTATSNAGRLRITGSTPNIGHGPLEVRTQNNAGQRRFVCGTDTFTVSQSQTNFICPNGADPKQIIYQNVYRKVGNQMQRWERMAGSMTYHAAHSHYHVNDWTTMTLRLEQAGEPNPLNWPIVATGAKIGFCLMDYGTCTTYNGHCRTSQEYGGGTTLVTSQFPNQGLSGGYGCGTNIQGISVGRTDIYSESLDMMWIILMPNLCNGNYWIVSDVDPTNVFLEENEENNWTAIPFTLTQQRPNGSGGTAGIFAPNGLSAPAGGTVTLQATPGNSYLWSNGATTRSIMVGQAGTYSVQVTQPCGVLQSAPVTVSFHAAPAPPVAPGTTVIGPASAELTASGAGQEFIWYDAAVNGQQLGTGSTFTTPVLNNSTTYHVSTRLTVPGVSANVGKTNITGAQNANNARQWTLFDAYEPFVIESVKVYATGNGERHFVLVDNTGSLLAEKVVYVPAGTHRVDLDFQVPAGTAHRITAFDDNTEIVLALHRDDSGVNYPYAIGSLGSITGSTAGGSFYYYLYDWEVRTPDVVMESPRTAATVTVTQGVVVAPRIFLEGPYTSATGMMSDALRVGGYIPATEPFTALGFTHAGDGGGEVLNPALLTVTGADAIVDWLLVELRSNVNPSQVIATRSALVKRSGHVVAADGGPVRFPVQNGPYHVAIRHRNHLACMTAAPVSLGSVALSIDFTAPATATWGTAARKVAGPVMLLWMGNVVADGTLKYTGAANDRDPILAAVGGLAPTNTVNGYHQADSNLDGVVRYTGGNNDRDPILANIGGVVPTNTLPQQLP
jgi:hypothetical protein